jgi:hypothetical protein
MTIGPEPKLIRTGATLHTVCITNGSLHTYNLFDRVYGGKSDRDINVHNEHTSTKLKMVSLYNLMLHPSSIDATVLVWTLLIWVMLCNRR